MLRLMHRDLVWGRLTYRVYASANACLETEFGRTGALGTAGFLRI